MTSDSQVGVLPVAADLGPSRVAVQSKSGVQGYVFMLRRRKLELF